MQGALAALAECEKMLQSLSRRHWNYLINAFRSRLYIDAGNTENADKWFDSCKLGIFMEVSRAREFELIVYTRALMARGSLNDAELLLKRILVFTEHTARRHSRVEILNLLGMITFQKGETPVAMTYLEESLVIGIEEGYIRSYVDEVGPMARILKYYIMHRKK